MPRTVFLYLHDFMDDYLRELAFALANALHPDIAIVILAKYADGFSQEMANGVEAPIRILHQGVIRPDNAMNMRSILVSSDKLKEFMTERQVTILAMGNDTHGSLWLASRKSDNVQSVYICNRPAQNIGIFSQFLLDKWIKALNHQADNIIFTKTGIAQCPYWQAIMNDNKTHIIESTNDNAVDSGLIMRYKKILLQNGHAVDEQPPVTILHE